MTKTLRMIAVCASFGVAACTQSPDKCDAVADSGTTASSEAMLEVVNLTGGPLRLSLGTDEPVSVPNGEAYKVVEKATSGLKDTLKTNVRLIASDGGTSGSDVETAIDIAPDEVETLVALSTTTGVVLKSTKQTQGANFGEKVNAGLHAAGSALAQGASLSVDYTGDCMADIGGEVGRKARVVLADSADTVPECDDVRVFVRPALAPADSIPYAVVVDGSLQIAWLSTGDHKTGLTSGRRTFHPRMFVTPPLPDVAVLNATTARISMNVTTPKQTLARDVAPGTLVHLSAKTVALAMDDEAASLAGAGVVSAAVSFVAGNTTTTIPLVGGFGTGELLLIASEQPGVLRGGAHAPSRNRRELIFGSAVSAQATGCVGVAPNDDVCAMGTAISTVGALTNSGGGAAAASYAATGRLLAPSNVNDATGQAPKLPFIYVEDGRRFDFSLPPTVVAPLASHGGFFVVAGGTAADLRTLHWVDTSTKPWALTTLP